ncbi:MAG: hypothetical protein ABI615_05085 [Chthoniobacterales bacterium]
MNPEIIESNGKRYAEIIRANAKVECTRFFSPPEMSLQFGLLAHPAGFVEAPHSHHSVKREILDMQQMFVMQRGKLAVEFYTDEGVLFREVELGAGDAIVLIHGVHGLRVLEDFQAVSVKQGPFLGDQKDKISVEVKS